MVDDGHVRTEMAFPLPCVLNFLSVSLSRFVLCFVICAYARSKRSIYLPNLPTEVSVLDKYLGKVIRASHRSIIMYLKTELGRVSDDTIIDSSVRYLALVVPT